MTTYIIRRSIHGIFVLLIMTAIVFSAMRLLPGDPLKIFVGQQASSGGMSEEQLEGMRRYYGLDKPIIIQYFSWLGGVFRGNLGKSLYYHQDVGGLLLERFPITLHLGITAWVLSTLVGVTLGVLAGIRRGTWIDSVATTIANIGVCIPIFWLGVLLIYVLGLKFRLLPIFGYTSPLDDF